MRPGLPEPLGECGLTRILAGRAASPSRRGGRSRYPAPNLDLDLDVDLVLVLVLARRLSAGVAKVEKDQVEFRVQVQVQGKVQDQVACSAPAELDSSVKGLAPRGA